MSRSWKILKENVSKLYEIDITSSVTEMIYIIKVCEKFFSENIFHIHMYI